MSDFKLTNQQKLAHCYDRHLSVNANAGSGKTAVLVGRYIDILLDNLGTKNEVKPSEIVAITFTRKAAGEMKSKIIRRLENTIKTEKNPIKLKQLDILREKMTAARISTIHSFCSELLRTYPVEAGVSPNFSEISDADLALLQYEAIVNKIEDRLESEDEKIFASINELINVYTKKNLVEAIKYLISRKELLINLLDFYQSDISKILEARNYELDLSIRKVFEGVGLIFKELNAINDDNVPFKNIASYREFKNYLKSLLEINNQDLTHHLFVSLLSEYRTFSDVIFYKNNKLKKGSFKLVEESTLNSIENQHLITGPEIDLLNEILPNEIYDKNIIEISKQIVELANEIADELDYLKERRESLDFDDLIIKTSDLLKDPDVNQKVIKRIKYLMVDEFQDTNQTQYDIMRLLVPELELLSSESLINLFIVGDWKQSIYGFRKADVKVFKKAAQDISSYNNHQLTTGLLSKNYTYKSEKIIPERQEQEKGNIILDSSFRLQPVLASFVNKICGNLMDESISEFDVRYDDLVCAKSVPELLSKNEDEILTSEFGSLSFLITISTKDQANESNSEDSSSEEESESPKEAGLIADYIKDLVQSERLTVYDDELKCRRNIRFGDVAVLSRKKTKFSILSAALLAKSIPYVLSSGSGFYNAREVQDLSAYLHFLVNPKDNISFFALLRSYFFNFSDESLFTIAQYNKDKSYWENFHELAINAEKQKYFDDFASVFSLLKGLINHAGTLSITQNIRKLIEKTNWNLSISKYTAAEQIRSNVDKFTEIARNFEKRGFTSLPDFTDYLDSIYDSSSSEDEAIVISDENAVRMMSVHSAKGLEFPLVILYDTNSKGQGENQFNVNDKYGISFKCPVLTDDGNMIKVTTPVYHFSNQIKRQKELAEEKRILYVAMTRAKEHLVICANLLKKNNGEIGKLQGFFELITTGLGADVTRYEDDSTWQTQSNITLIDDDNLLHKKNIIYPINLIRNILFADEQTNANLTIASDDSEILINPLESEIENEHYSASKFITLQTKSDIYLKKYILNYPDELINQKYNTNIISNEIPVSGTEFGSIVHYLFEKLNLWLDYSSQINEEKLIEVINNNTIVDKELNSKLASPLIEAVKKVVSTDFIKNHIKELLDAKKEYKLNMPLGNDILRGIFDLLIYINGETEIWDWKTNRIYSEEKYMETAAYYEFQMKVYLYFLSFLNPGKERYTARLLFTSIVDTMPDKWVYTYQLVKNEIADFEKQLTALSEKSKSAYFNPL